jgi:hypothetical protein
VELAVRPIPSLERTATGYAAWPFRSQRAIVSSRAKPLRRRRPAQLELQGLPQKSSAKVVSSSSFFILIRFVIRCGR